MGIAKSKRVQLCFLMAFLMAMVGMLTRLSAEDAAPAADAAAAPAAAPATAPAAGPTPAEQAADGPAPLPNTTYELIRDASGTFGFSILFLSMVFVFLAIQIFMDTAPRKLMPPEVLGEMQQMFDEGNFEGALELCQQEENYMTRIIGAGLSKMAYGFDRTQDAMNEEADLQTTRIHQRLGYINLIAQTCPMLGLLGTVSGMIGSFGMIASKPTANPADLAGGIYVALVTTIEGLCVAIPATIVFMLLRNRITGSTMEMGLLMTETMDRFRTTE